MSDSTTSTPTLDPLAAAPEGDAERDSVLESTPLVPGRLDSPIERIDMTPPDTFIPESVDQLLAHSRRYPLLTPAQEIELAKRIERGDLHAKELLVNSNLRLVASNARRYQNQGLPLGDLVQEGMLGLIRASEKFDWRKGFRFSTYATLWISRAIPAGLANYGRATTCGSDPAGGGGWGASVRCVSAASPRSRSSRRRLACRLTRSRRCATSGRGPGRSPPQAGRAGPH